MAATAKVNPSPPVLAPKKEIWGKRTFCVVSGASRGIGKCIALKASEKLAPGSVMCLLAKPDSNLEDTQRQIEKSTSEIFVYSTPLDLGDTSYESFEEIVGKCFERKVKPSDFEVAIIFHNAGSVGDTTSRALEYTDPDFIVKFYRDNFVSTVTLNAAFFHYFYETDSTKVVVNISSLFGIQPTAYFGAYCSVKAARNMLFKVLSKEEPNITVLNYSPGHVETDMWREVRGSRRKEVQSVVNNVEQAGLVLSCEQTVNRLIKVLEERKFRSGQNVDYFGQSDDENDMDSTEEP